MDPKGAFISLEDFVSYHAVQFNRRKTKFALPWRIVSSFRWRGFTDDFSDKTKWRLVLQVLSSARCDPNGTCQPDQECPKQMTLLR